MTPREFSYNFKADKDYTGVDKKPPCVRVISIINLSDVSEIKVDVIHKAMFIS